MAVGADFNLNFGFCGAGIIGLSAGAADFGRSVIFRMYVFFHGGEGLSRSIRAKRGLLRGLFWPYVLFISSKVHKVFKVIKPDLCFYFTNL